MSCPFGDDAGNQEHNDRGPVLRYHYFYVKTMLYFYAKITLCYWTSKSL